MKSVLLRLEGPMQSWGTQGRFSIRDTDTEPSKSGVIGVVAAALGIPRENDVMVERLASLSMAVRVDREGRLVRDYHTAGGGLFRGRAHSVHGTRDTVVTERYYLADASFLVGLGSSDGAFIEEIGAALANPKWPLFLGRKSCVPSSQVFVGIQEGAPEVAIRVHPLGEVTLTTVRLVIECGAIDGAVPRNDVPLSFGLYRRRHVRRFVRTEWMEAPFGSSVEGV